MNDISRFSFGLIFTVSVIVGIPLQAQQLPRHEELMERLAGIQMNVTDARQAGEMLVALRLEAVTYRDANPELPEAWTASARVGAVYALRQGMGGLGMARDVKAELEKSIELDPSAERGMAQGYLGQVYLLVPGWPIGFGDDEKGTELMTATLNEHPDNGLINVLYAQRLIARKQYIEAQEYLDRASALIDADLAHPLFQQLQRRNIAGYQRAISEELARWLPAISHVQGAQSPFQPFSPGSSLDGIPRKRGERPVEYRTPLP